MYNALGFEEQQNPLKQYFFPLIVTQVFTLTDFNKQIFLTDICIVSPTGNLHFLSLSYILFTISLLGT